MQLDVLINPVHLEKLGDRHEITYISRSLTQERRSSTGAGSVSAAHYQYIVSLSIKAE
jgi:hypothetical protein